MKTNNILYRTAALFLLTLAAACSRDDEIVAPGDETAATPLRITVTDAGYADARAPHDATRAVERSYGTEFTAGDRIGLYAVQVSDAGDPQSDRIMIYENICLTHDGTSWTLPEGRELTHQPPKGGEILYFAYYPWQQDMTGKVDIHATDPFGNSTTEAPRFFLPLIENWQPAAIQNTYAAYTASDLMVALGEVSLRTDGDGSLLSFTMEHQMGLVVIRVPTTKYTYQETVGNVTKTKSYRLYTGMPHAELWLENGYTGRFIVHPAKKIYHRSHYFDSDLVKHTFTADLINRTPGTYHLITVDGGAETVKSDRPLREGDFYMRDGGIIPQEKVPEVMPSEPKSDCLGVVFWVGENEGKHWTQSSSHQGDQLLRRHYPKCNNAMVVALHDASEAAKWGTGPAEAEGIYDWASNYSGFTSYELLDFKAIAYSDTFYGYGYTRLMGLYEAYHTDATFPAKDAIAAFATVYPAPAGSSGWFMPGRNELWMMRFGKPSPSEEKTTQRQDFLNGQFMKAGGDTLEAKYWGASDMDVVAFRMEFGRNPFYSMDPKSNNYRVRAVLAF